MKLQKQNQFLKCATLYQLLKTWGYKSVHDHLSNAVSILILLPKH